MKVAETSSFLGSSLQTICGRYRLGAYKPLYNCICNKLVVVVLLVVVLLVAVVVTVVDVDMIVVVLVVAMVVVVSQSPDLGGKII